MCCRWGLQEAGGPAGQQLLGVLLGSGLLEERLDIQGSLWARQTGLGVQGGLYGGGVLGRVCGLAGPGVQGRVCRGGCAGWVCGAACAGAVVQGRPCPCPCPHPDSTTFPSLRLALDEAGAGFSPVGNI